MHDETIRITGPLLTASGTANFGKTGELTLLNFSSIKLGPQNDLSFQLTRSAAMAMIMCCAAIRWTAR